MGRERFVSEKIAGLAWKIPGLGIVKQARLVELVTQREAKQLWALEEQILRKVQALAAEEQNAQVAPGFKGAIMGFSKRLEGEKGKGYECRMTTDGKRMEIVIVDALVDFQSPIRKFRMFIGKYGEGEDAKVYDLSCSGERRFSMRRNFYDADDNQRGLTLKESCLFAEEILRAYPVQQTVGNMRILIK